MRLLFAILAAGAALFTYPNASMKAAETAVKAADTITDPTSKHTFPSQVSFEDGGKTYNLKATGAATRSKLFIKVYSLGHYMENPPQGTGDKVFEEILTDGKAKQANMYWLYAVDGKKIHDGFLESFNAVIPQQSAETKATVESFLKSYAQNVSPKDEYILRWLPGGKVELLINGQKKGEWTDPALAKGIWAVWFGPKSVVNRANLVSELGK